MVKLGNMARLIRHLVPMVYQQYRVSLKKLGQALNRYEHWRKLAKYLKSQKRHKTSWGQWLSARPVGDRAAVIQQPF